MSRYTYHDEDGDKLLIENAGSTIVPNMASVSVHGNAVYVPAAEAPKAAQAILDAAGVKGVVVIDANFSNTVTVKIDASDIVKQIVFLKDLPEVTGSSRGTYRTENGIRWIALDSTDPYNDINTHIRGLLAIKLRMEADKEAEGAKLTQQIKEAADFRANQARIEAEKKAAAAKKAHDDLRTSPIALKALAIYDRACIGCGPYESWDATLDGDGVGEWTVRHFIRLAEKEEAKEKEAAEKLAARRDQLVRNHALGLDAYCYDDLDVNGKYLVDRLRIALDEGKDAK